MSKKSSWTKWLVLVAGIALLASCGGGGGGGGGGADSLSITKTSPVSQTNTFAESGSDPMIYADITGGSSSTEITMCSGVVGYSCTDRSIHIKINALVQKDASYTVSANSSATNQAWAYYTESGVAYYSETGGTVSITRIDGTAGGRIQGSFSNITVSTLGASSSITMNGTFDVTIDSVL